MRRFICLLLILPGVLVFAGDFPQPYDSEPNKSVVRLPPEQAAASFKLPEGFKAQVFAAEPEVMNPIAMAWDSRGRMWVAENYTYAESAKRFDLSLRDRVIILEDKDHDGRAETRTVFTDDVQMLTSVEVGRGGVWLMAPPQLLFIPDKDGDDKPDSPPVVVLDGFTVAKANYHNFANGLRWGPDGWLYGRCGHSCPGRIGVPGTPDELRVPINGGIWRFHPERKVFEVLCHGTTNPWGHDWDKDGELFFINTVNGHLWHVMAGAHLKEGGASKNPGVYERLDTIADHLHYDAKAGWQNKKPENVGKIGGGHAHVGMMIYQGDQWPEQYRNKLFTLNFHGQRTNVERLEQAGAGYVGRHDQDIFQSGDPWFRGMEISTGPDGSGYILDWSDIGECHEHTGVHRNSGRVFKISYGEPKPPAAALYPRCLMGDGKLQTLWKDYQAGKTTPEQLRALLNDPDEHVRVWAIRLLTDFWPLDTIVGPKKDAIYPDDAESRAAFVKLATSDPSGLVHLALASVLQRLPVERRAELASALVKHKEYAGDQNLPSMVWFGLIPLGEKDPVALASIARECAWPTTDRWIARNLASNIQKKPEGVNALIAAMKGMPVELRESSLKGMSEAFRGWRKAPTPEAWGAFTQSPAAGESPDLVRELSSLFGDGRAMDEIRKVALDGKAELSTREAALKSLIDARPPDLRSTCESLLDVPTLAATAVRGMALFDDPKIGEQLARTYPKFRPADRAAVLDVLVSRPSFAAALLNQVGKGKPIPAAEVTAFHARQIRSLNVPALTAKLTEVWGDLNETEAAQLQQIAMLKTKLTPEVLGKADLSQGRLTFTKTCAVCHTLYGEGGKVGPDLTGSGRADLDYLLQNIVTPSAVVAADYRMTVFTLKDDRVLNGIVVRRDDRTITLREQTQETTIERSEVVKEKASPLSMMPDGLLQALNEIQVRDLIAYLMHPKQVPAAEAK